MIREFFAMLLACCVISGVCYYSGEEAHAVVRGAQNKSKSKKDDVQVVVIHPVGNEMKYKETEFTVKAGAKVKIIMDNTATAPAMKHNVVILKPGSNINKIGVAAITAGVAKQFIPDDKNILFYTPMAAPKQKTEVEFVVPPPGDYPYTCTFTGHFVTMKGVMHSVK